MKTFILLFSEVPVKAVLLHILLHTLVLVVKLTFKDLEEVLDCKNKYNLKNKDNLKK